MHRTFHNMIIRSPIIRLVVNVENRRVRKVQPQEIRREHPVLIPTCRIGAGVILVCRRESVPRQVVLRVPVNDPRHHGLELVVRLVGAVPVVRPWVGRGQGRGTGVVPDDTRRDGERLARVVEDAAAGHGGVVEAVAARGRVGSHPVVAWFLVCVDDDHVALSFGELMLASRPLLSSWTEGGFRLTNINLQARGRVRLNGYQVRFDNSQIMIVNGEDETSPGSAIDKPKDMLLALSKICLEVRASPS